MPSQNALHCWAKEENGSYLIKILVSPRSSKTRIMGEHDGFLKVAIACPPVDGAANEALIIFLSKLLQIPKSAIDLASGRASRKKTLRIPMADSTKSFVSN